MTAFFRFVHSVVFFWRVHITINVKKIKKIAHGHRDTVLVLKRKINNFSSKFKEFNSCLNGIIDIEVRKLCM